MDNSTKKSNKLGSIITYKNEYMCLAFTRFDNNNQAYFSGRGEYEQCLREMWEEIRRVYAQRPVTIPLLGASVPIFKNSNRPSKAEFLKCMLCTLKSSNIYLDTDITIILDKKSAQEINLYEIKGELS